MDIIDKINNTRYTLKEVLVDEWNVEDVPDLSSSEIDRLYGLPESMDSNTSPFGIASGCNLTLTHKVLPSHKLHVIYYNFPEIGRMGSKVTKSVCDKIINYYSSESIQQDDSILLIINDVVSESLMKSFDKLNVDLQNIYYESSISDDIIKEMKDNSHFLENKHFRNVHIFGINSLTNNLLKHRLVPKHDVVRNRKQIEEILQTCNCSLGQLPIILKNDIISKLLRLSPGDICDIKRKSRKSGEYSFYRVCK